MNVDEICAVINTKKGLEIGPKEFIAGFKSKIPELTEEDLTDLFKVIDIDMSGTLVIDEIRTELSNIDAALVLRDIK